MTINKQRAKKGKQVLAFLASLYSTFDEEADLTDALADIAHAKGPEFVDNAVLSALSHYVEEIS